MIEELTVEELTVKKLTVEELARALVELDGYDPDEGYLPRGLVGKPMPRWRLYGASRARELLGIVERRREGLTSGSQVAKK